MNINEKVVQVAKGYIGQTEIRGNNGFLDKKFEKEMVDVGFQKTWAWCALFAELVWKKSYFAMGDHEKVKEISKLFSPSTLKTLGNFQLDKTWKVDKVPQVGDVLIFQNGTTYLGHAAIIVEVLDGGKKVRTIEGNTSANPEDREGTTVATRIRTVSFAPRKMGLWMKAVIHLK